MEAVLTKSSYLRGIHCEKKLWLHLFKPELASPPSAGDLSRMRTGEYIGSLARQLIPGGIMARSQPSSDHDDAAQTAGIIASGSTVLYEPTFIADRFLARCDILVKDTEGWQMIEVKSSTRAKDEHIEDVAFQVMVLELSGLHVNTCSLCLVNNSSVRVDDELSSDELLKIEDITAGVRQLIPDVTKRSQQLLSVISQQLIPRVDTNLHCVKPATCPFYDYCHVGQSEIDVISLPGIRSKEVTEFRDLGIETIDQIPDNAKLSVHQQRARHTIRFHEPFVGDNLSKKLGKINFPAEFIDFEAAGPVIPQFPGMRPYQSFPFQWSSHRLETETSTPEHFGYLHQEFSDPRIDFARSLFEQVENANTILYYSNYELSTVKNLAETNIPFGEELHALLSQRGLDLLKLIKDEIYHEQFHGSFSIKKVLPALVPNLNYNHLAIQDGDSAAVEYLRAFSPATTEADKQKIFANLEAYCELDTFAMVMLYLSLKELSR